MLHLIVDMFERVGFIITIAFLFSRSKWMRSYMGYQGERRNQWRFIALFGFYAILGTYSGVAVSNLSYESAPWITFVTQGTAIANSRTIGVVIAGLLGGMKSGVIVGLIAGAHRYSLGGFVAIPCLVAPILQGLLAGMMRKAIRKRLLHISSVKLAFMVGFLAESLQMAIILLLAKPWDRAWNLVSLIGIPQIISNSVGVALFFMLYIQIEKEEERIGTLYANKALQIADMTLPYWKNPFEDAVRGIARILVDETKAVGVFFFKGEKVEVQEGRQTQYCMEVPIERQNKKMVGIFRLYFVREQEISLSIISMLNSLARLFSQQFAFVEAGRQAQLLADAEIRSLQAQMNPHFLFNVLNTVKSFIRTKPDEARQMTTQLAKFLRQNMVNYNKSLIPIRDELELVMAYLNLSKARIGERLQIITDIDDALANHMLPPFTIQPLVENAIVHGLKNIHRQGIIRLIIKRDQGQVLIVVEDNGVGFDLSHPTREGGEGEHIGVALGNIEQRLQFHFGAVKALHFETKPNEGTKVSFWVR